jgi:hypothetical protein
VGGVGDDHGRIFGQLIPEQRIVILNERHLDALEAKDGRLRRYTIGHELGHWDLHAEAARSGALSPLRPTADIGSGPALWRVT